LDKDKSIGKDISLRYLIATREKKLPEFLELFIYLIAAFILVYYVDFRLNRWLFLIYLPIIWYSKRDYLWISFFFILMEMPGGLFSGGMKDDPYRLPIYSIAPGFSFAFHELIIILFFFKSIFKRRITGNYNPPYFKKEMKLLFWLYIILVLISPLLGMSRDSMSNVFKLSISLTLFYSLFRLINTEEQLFNFMKMLFPFVFVALGLQVFGLLTGNQFISLFKPGVSVVQGSYNFTTKNNQWIRPIEMGHTMFITFTGSLLLIMSQRQYIKKLYLVFINLISFLVILMSGTRSWFIAFCFGYVLFFLIAGIKTPKMIINSIIILLIVLFSVKGIPVIDKQVKNALNRFATIEKVAGGDITGGGTISRYDIRGPRVIEGFISSTIVLGSGFSDHFFKYSDGHVGYHNMLLNAGIAGFLIFLYTIWKMLRYPFKITAKYCYLNKKFIRATIIPLIILLIINTGTQTIGFTPDGVNRIILMVFSLLMIDLVVKIELNKANTI
jgi:hypothetical protein